MAEAVLNESPAVPAEEIDLKTMRRDAAQWLRETSTLTHDISVLLRSPEEKIKSLLAQHLPGSLRFEDTFESLRNVRIRAEMVHRIHAMVNAEVASVLQPLKAISILRDREDAALKKVDTAASLPLLQEAATEYAAVLHERAIKEPTLGTLSDHAEKVILQLLEELPNRISALARSLENVALSPVSYVTRNVAQYGREKPAGMIIATKKLLSFFEREGLSAQEKWTRDRRQSGDQPLPDTAAILQTIREEICALPEERRPAFIRNVADLLRNHMKRMPPAIAGMMERENVGYRHCRSCITLFLSDVAIMQDDALLETVQKERKRVVPRALPYSLLNM